MDYTFNGALYGSTLRGCKEMKVRLCLDHVLWVEFVWVVAGLRRVL